MALKRRKSRRNPIGAFRDMGRLSIAPLFVYFSFRALFAIPEGSESIHDAAIRVVQDEVDDAIIFEKNAKSKVLK